MIKVTFAQAAAHLVSWSRDGGGIGFNGICPRGLVCGTGQLSAISDGQLEFEILEIHEGSLRIQELVVDSKDFDTIWYSSSVTSPMCPMDVHCEQMLTFAKIDGASISLYKLKGT